MIATTSSTGQADGAPARPRVLVTNDDGIDSPGLLALARCAADLGYQTVVAAPAVESSGTGAGLNAARDDRRVLMDRRTLPGLPEVDTLALAAYPALIAMIACQGGLGAPPDIVLSGVNRGANVGRGVLHSGTVGAALTAGINGARALAVSLDVDVADRTAPHWDSAIAAVTRLLPIVAGMDAGSILSLNVPNVPVDQIRPLRWARLATFGQAHNRITQVRADTIEVTSVVVDGELEPGTDAALLAAGHATITPLRSVSENEELMTGDLPVLPAISATISATTRPC